MSPVERIVGGAAPVDDVAAEICRRLALVALLIALLVHGAA